MNDKKIFISYSRKDKDQVFDIVRQIEDKVGVKCWIDVNGIESGQQFVDVIMGAIENCEVVIFMMSASSLKSDYARKEVNYANLLKKIIVPVILDGDKLRGWFAFDFSLTDFIVASNPEHISKLMRDLCSWLGTDISSSVVSGSYPFQSANEVYLKVLSNLDCKVLIDCEEKVQTAANRLAKIPLPVGEYYAEFISTENPADAIAREILLEHDKLEKVDLFSLKQEREKAEEVQGRIAHIARTVSMTFVPFISNNRIGFFNLEIGEISISPRYNAVCAFCEDLAAVSLNDKWGFIDKSGREVIPCMYDDVFSFHEGLAEVRLNGKIGFIDKSNREVTPCMYDDVFSFHEGLVQVRLNGKIGFIDKSGGKVVLGKYDYVHDFHEGLAAVRFNDKWGFIDKSGHEVIPCMYDNIHDFHEGLAAVRLNDKWGFIDKSGQEVVSCRWYDDVFDFHEGLASAYRYGKWGFVDKSDCEVIRCRYDFAYHFNGGLAAVCLNDKWGFIDKSGREVIPCMYDNIHDFHEGLAAVFLNDKWGFIDKSGREVIPCTHDSFGISDEGFVEIQLNGRWGMMDRFGCEIIPCIYDECTFNEGVIWVELNGREGCVDLFGNEMWLEE